MKKFLLPDLGEGLPDAIIREWYVQVGDTVTVDQPIVAMETAKALVDVPAPFDGKIEKRFGDVGDTIMTGDPLVGFEGSGEADQTQQADSGTVVGKIESSNTLLEENNLDLDTPSSAQMSTPGVRALARRRGIDLSETHRRLRIRDVKAIQSTSPVCPADYQPLTPVRRAMIASMERSHQTIVPVTINDAADISAWYKRDNITLRTLRAITAACQAEPMLNAYFDDNSLAFKLNSSVNVGLAVDTPQGLYVPVLHDVQDQSDEALRETINTYKTQASSHALPATALQGATIVLSNFGTIAGRYATPIILPPMVAIIGIGKLHDAVVPNNGEIAIHKQLPISLTVDHRLITGGETARFLATLIQTLEAG